MENSFHTRLVFIEKIKSQRFEIKYRCSKIVYIETAYLLAAALAVVHFFGEEIDEVTGNYREMVISFATGVSITYVFLQLLPDFHSIVAGADKTVFLFPLFGFSAIHLAEKYVAKTGASREVMKKRYKEIHSVFLFIYHGAIGFLITVLLAESITSGLLFFLPILFHSAVSSFSLSELHEDVVRLPAVKVAISAAPLLGVLLHQTGFMSSNLLNPVFGIVIGMFVYVVIRDAIPEGDKGKPKGYILGLLSYLAIILLIWL